ncbi:MAG: acyclic terpene utilization AtuA family protein [Francisella endosymbiont of Hyalomma asiaticum]
MGVKPLIKALDAGAQIILTGRCYDLAVFTTGAIRKGYDPWLANTYGKNIKILCYNLQSQVAIPL